MKAAPYNPLMVSAEFVAFDLETTGLSVMVDRIIEVGAVRFDVTGRVLGEFEVVVDPGMPIPLAIQRLVGLTDADVRGAPSPSEAVGQLAEFAAGASLVAHGAAFDLAYCAAVLPQVFTKREAYDTLELARILMPAAPSHSLPQLTTYLGIAHDRPHRALSDADATRVLFTHLIGLTGKLPAGVLAQIRARLTSVRSSLHDFFTAVAQGPGDTAAVDLPGGLVPPLGPLRVPQPPGDVGGDAAKLLGPGGPFDDDGYEYRDAQLEMARAVGQTLQRSGRLLIEAGTGIGKSYAYLAPLLLHVQRSGERGVVATYTITLQEQLAERDIQKVAGALGKPLAVAMLKGRQHYLSLRRWQRLMVNPDGGRDSLRFNLKLLVWLSGTRSGDRSELHLNGAEESLWRQVQSDAGDCLGSACANWNTARCFMVAARRTASQADVVVTNHALLLADAERQGTVLDHYSALVVDEAHHLEEVATQQLGAQLRAADVLELLNRLPMREGSSAYGLMKSALDATTRLFGDIKGLVAARQGNDSSANTTLAWIEELRSDPASRGVVRSARLASAALRSAEESLTNEALPEIDTSALPEPERCSEEAQQVAWALLEAATIIESVIITPREGFVSWLELRAEQAELHEAPVSVSNQLRDSVFDKVDAVVLTSATLAVAGSFGFIRSRLGIGGGADELALASPFDYLGQALSVVPTDMPDYAQAHYDDAMARLIGDVAIRLGGRTLALFTGYGPLRRVHSILDRRLGGEGIAVLGQGLDGTRRQVLHSFLDHPRTVLLGTTSFWEGIDIPGDALRCVVIAKLPFAVPSDPLVQARIANLRDPFRDYILPLAVLRLKQGFGRLVRRRGDRGAVIIGDVRLESRDYARTFLESLPPSAVARLPVAGVAEAVGEFVERGQVPDGAVVMAKVDAVNASHHEEPA